MATVPEQWVERAQYDLDTATAMLDSGRYLYVVFCCQQAVEKALKGLIAVRTAKTPPRTHNLMRLATEAGLEVSEIQADLFTRLTSYYVHSRYPEEMAAWAWAADAALASQALRSTQEMVQWLFKMIT